MDQEWIEHRRGMDGELLGWMKPADEGFVAIDLLGRPCTDVVDWFTAEEALESMGIGYLADPYELRLDSGEWLRVRITEISTAAIRVKKDDWGALGAPQLNYSLEFPVTDELRVIAP